MMQRVWYGVLMTSLVALLASAVASASAAPRVPDGAEREILWGAKQALFERLEVERWLPPDATRASQDEYDVLFYDIDIAIDPGPETVEGVVVMRAESTVAALSTVVLNFFDNMTVDSVTGNSAPLAFTHASDLLTVTLDEPSDAGETFEIAVAYHGSPVDGALDFSTHWGEPIISSLSEPTGAREWWPCKDRPDDKADSVRIALTVPDDLVAVSEGLLVSETDNGNGTKTYEWFEGYPVTTYLVSVAISNYEVFTDWYHPARGDSMPITNYVYPEDLSDAMVDLDITADAIGFLASVYGEYPFIEEKYGHAEFPWGGAMEHQTCTSYGAVLIRGDHYYDWILVHELAHQWWGDWVTCATWDDIWLNEGFASYSEALWFEHLGGPPSYRSYVNSYDSYGYFDGPVYDPWSTFGRTVYDKGALVLHMLRRVLELDGGPQAHYPLDGLEQVLATYGAAKAYDSAVTPEFQTAAESVYGASLDWFFQEWVYGENRPEYEYSWVASSAGDHWDVMVHIEQVQTDAGLFTMPIDLRVETPGADELVTLWNDQWSQDFFIETQGMPMDVDLDPYNWVLKDVSETTTGAPEAPVAASVSFGSNPAVGSAVMALTVPASGRATVSVYDATGRRVATPLDSVVPAGSHEIRWNGRDESGQRVASGVYFVRLDTPSGSDLARVAFVR
jgi:aminopeptidase N